VQADGRLVEDVRDVGERGTEVADHLDALRLAARERARRAVEAEVAEPDGDRRVEGLLQPVDAWHTGFAVMVDTAVRGPLWLRRLGDEAQPAGKDERWPRTACQKKENCGSGG